MIHENENICKKMYILRTSLIYLLQMDVTKTPEHNNQQRFSNSFGHIMQMCFCECASVFGRGGQVGWQQLKNSVHETSIKVLNKHTDKTHFFAGVLKDDTWVIRQTAQAVGGHHHRQVTHIHFCNGHIGRLSKHLKKVKVVKLLIFTEVIRAMK